MSWILESQIEEMKEEIKAFKEVLEFYASEKNYDSPIYDEHGELNGSLVDKDSGEKAREILKKY